MSGIAFKIGDEFLKLPEGQKLSISIENPLFTENTLAGAISLPFSMPNIAHNQKLLKISNTLMSFEDTEIVSGVALYLGGNYWRDGKLIVNSQSPKTINLTFVEFNREDDVWNNYINQLKNYPTIPLPDLSNADEQFINSIDDRSDGIYPNNEKDFVCPVVYNSKVLEEILNFSITFPQNTQQQEINEKNKVQFQNLYDSNGYKLKDSVNNIVVISGTPSTSNQTYTQRNYISPFFYVSYILKHIGKYMGLDFGVDNIFYRELESLIIYTNKSFLLNTFYHPTNGTLRMTMPFLPEFKYENYIPNIKIIDFLNYLKNCFNLVYFIDYINKTFIIRTKKDILKCATVIELTSKSEIYNQINFDKNIQKKYKLIKYNNADDEIINSDFVYNNHYYKGIKNSVSELPTSALKPYFYKIYNSTTVYNDDTYLLYSWNGSSFVLKNYSDYKFITPYNIIIDDSGDELDLKISTFVVRENLNEYKVGSNDFTRNYFTPSISLNIFRDEYSTYKNTPVKIQEAISSLKLFFYRGKIQELNNGFLYPYASRTNFKPTRQTSPTLKYNFQDLYEFSLDIDGPKGIYESWYREWNNMLYNIRRIATYNLRLQAGEINADLFTNYIQIESKRFVLKKLTINATPTNILPCKAEMYQIEPSK